MSTASRSTSSGQPESGPLQLGLLFEAPATPKAPTVAQRPSPSLLPTPATPPLPEEPPVAEEQEEELPERRVWNVGALVGEVRNHIEGAYADVWVRGEISNLRAAPSGHVYFTLKDGDAQLPAVLFRKQARLLRFKAADGLEVLLRGRVSVYEQRGQMQLIAEYLEPVGAGSLQLAFEQLKKKLGGEGLFAQERKRPLPSYPHCVGIVTSPTGAVIRDFLNVVGRRHAALDVLLFPAVVQGESAAAEIAAGILYFNRERNVDVIVIARGGGSLEDMAAFNSETVARAIAASDLPVVSAVGHETDFTIADFVADLRAPTPSAAAELITAAQHRIEEQVDALHARLGRAMRYQLSVVQQRMARIAVTASAAKMRDALGRKSQRIDELAYRMERAQTARLSRCRDRLQQLTAAAARHEASQRLAVMRERRLGLDTRLAKLMEARLTAARHTAHAAGRALAPLSPTAVLGRGYALVFRPDGSLLRDAREAGAGDTITTRLAHGQLEATVTRRITEDA